eukprot:1543789-Prymnesium_polylepis.2
MPSSPHDAESDAAPDPRLRRSTTSLPRASGRAKTCVVMLSVFACGEPNGGACDTSRGGRAAESWFTPTMAFSHVRADDKGAREDRPHAVVGAVFGQRHPAARGPALAIGANLQHVGIHGVDVEDEARAVLPVPRVPCVVVLDEQRVAQRPPLRQRPVLWRRICRTREAEPPSKTTSVKPAKADRGGSESRQHTHELALGHLGPDAVRDGMRAEVQVDGSSRLVDGGAERGPVGVLGGRLDRHRPARPSDDARAVLRRRPRHLHAAEVNLEVVDLPIDGPSARVGFVVAEAARGRPVAARVTRNVIVSSKPETRVVEKVGQVAQAARKVVARDELARGSVTVHRAGVYVYRVEAERLEARPLQGGGDVVDVRL